MAEVSNNGQQTAVGRIRRADRPVIRSAIAAMMTLICAGELTAEEGRIGQSLIGSHPFRQGDDPDWAKPDFDDSGWRRIDIPGGWDEFDIPRDPPLGWYRIHFSADERLALERAALILGPVVLAEEIYLNGTLIGREGGFGADRIWGTAHHVAVYSIPKGLIRAGQDNVVAVRVQRLVVDGGIRSGPVAIGNEDSLRRTVFERQRWRLLAECAFLTFYASTSLFALALLALGFRDKQHVWFSALILQIGVSHFLESLLLDAIDGRSYLSAAAMALMDQLFPLSTFLFLRHTLRVPVGRWVRGLLAAYVLLCAVWWWSGFTKDQLYVWWVGAAVVLLGPVGIHWCLQAVRRRHHDGLSLLLGLSWCVATQAILLMPTLHTRIEPGQWGNPLLVPVAWYGWLGLHLCMIYTLAGGYQRTRRRLHESSQRLIAAQDDERRRVARELHDGVGQSVAAVKMQLEIILSRSRSGNAIDEQVIGSLVDETGNVADELHRVAVDLRLDVLEKLTLIEAVRTLSATVQQRTNLRVHVTGPEDFETTPAVREQLYRITQEALNNVVRHADASTVDIDFVDGGTDMVLRIEDNGRGFDAEGNGSLTPGVGLHSMQERAALIRGRLTITSRRDEGTMVRIEVPKS